MDTVAETKHTPSGGGLLDAVDLGFSAHRRAGA
jgi:hypothetical protein